MDTSAMTKHTMIRDIRWFLDEMEPWKDNNDVDDSLLDVYERLARLYESATKEEG